MTTTNKLTAETLTTSQIRDLRVDSDGTGTTLGTPCTVPHARQAIADALNNARAQEVK